MYVYLGESSVYQIAARRRVKVTSPPPALLNGGPSLTLGLVTPLRTTKTRRRPLCRMSNHPLALQKLKPSPALQNMRLPPSIAQIFVVADVSKGQVTLSHSTNSRRRPLGEIPGRPLALHKATLSPTLRKVRSPSSIPQNSRRRSLCERSGHLFA